MAGQVDVVHLWPLGALHTIRAAKALGIPTFLERPNAHTRFAYKVVEEECRRLGITMPPGHEHAFKPDWLEYEEAEFRLADKLLCPSDFVARTFRDLGFPAHKLVRHQYGYDEKVYYPDATPRSRSNGLTMLFVGGCAPRKGVHYALEAWLKSPAHRDGTFMIAGQFIPGYAELLSNQLAHPSVKVLGHRNDVPELMRKSDILILPTIEEGSALVTYEARASGCVLLVSDAAGAVCCHGENGLIHAAGDASTLGKQITMIHEDRDLLGRLRNSSLATIQEITWTAAGRSLLNTFHEIVNVRSES
jgi:glycosyltransferase involved in cell wall biosynthesis